jgi:hypothetical protein
MQPSSDAMPVLAAPEFVGMLPLNELAVLLIKHNDIHDGLFKASIEFQLAVGAFGPSPENQLPGAMVVVNRVGLVKVGQPDTNTIDAAQVNPVKKARGKSSKAT